MKDRTFTGSENAAGKFHHIRDTTRGRDTVKFDRPFDDYGVDFGKKVIVTLGDNRDVLIGMERLEFEDVTYVREAVSWFEL